MGFTPRTSQTTALCWVAGGASDITDCNGSATDLAENFGTEDPTIEAGDVVALSGQASSVADPNEGKPTTKAFMSKSTTPYQSNILGVISTNPNLVFGDDGVLQPEENPKPVSLSGRVPVKVSDENGPIAPGDLLTSSSTAGVAMKADPKKGSTIGKALSSFQGPGQGEIIMFVESRTSYNLAEALRDMDLEANTLTASSVRLTNGIQINQGSINEDGTLNEEIRDQVLTAEQMQKLVEFEVDKRIGEILASSLTASGSQSIESPIPSDPPESTNSAAPEATSSSQLADETQQTLDTMNSLLTSQNLSIDTLTVTDSTNLAQTQVAGTLSQDGTLIIDYGKQINVLGSTLFLQNDPLAGDRGSTPYGVEPLKLVDIGAGKVTIDRNGNLKITGELTAKRLTTNEIAIDTSNENSQTVGSATIKAGLQSLVIETAAIKPDAKILLTATTPTFGRTLYVAQKTDFEGFTVAVDGLAPASSIAFDWFIVNTQISGIR